MTASPAPYVIENMRDGYVELVDWVRDYGSDVAPRGMKTCEIEDATFVLNDPLDALPVGVGRDLNLAIGAAEALLLCGGISSPTLLTSVSSTFRRFLDGGDLHGGYGRRIRDQVPRVVERLAVDPDTRQAIITIWDPAYDQVDTRDLPCTLNFGFRVRDGKLNMSVCMRSSDLWLGLPYDVFTFTQLQCTVAHALGLPVGTYTHHAYSFHLYERNLGAIDKLHTFVPDVQDRAHPSGFGYPGRLGATPRQAVEDSQKTAVAIHNVEALPEDVMDSELWYEEILRGYWRLTPTDNFAK